MANDIKISKTDAKLGIDWDSAFDVITDLSLHGLATTWGITPSVSELANFIKGIRKSVSVDESVGSTSLRIILLCLASSLDELRPTSQSTEKRKKAREIIGETKNIIEETDYYLEKSFFVRPTSLLLYQDIRPYCIESLSLLWENENPEEIGSKLDRSFNLSLYRISTREPQLVKRIINHLHSDGQLIYSHENEWDIYRENLSHIFEVKPVFGQDDTHISLSQIYVSPRAIWRETIEDKDGDQEIYKHLVSLEEDTKQWLDSDEKHRKVRLIRGGPGSGKSTFAKSICSHMSKSHRYKPVFIELQRLKGNGTILEKTTKLLVEFEEFFSEDPLRKDLIGENEIAVLVFDGLDELVHPKSSGVQKICEDLWDQLDELLSTLNTQKRIRARAIVTGRDAIIQAATSSRRGRLLDARDSLEIVGLQELNERDFKTTSASADGQKESWWKRYAIAAGKDQQLPPIYNNPELDSLTSEPLLAYLIALSGKAEDSKVNEINNINEVYEKLIEDVWNRVWGDLPLEHSQSPETIKQAERRKGPVGVFKNQDDFQKILEFIAIAAWRGGESRTATLTEFESAIKRTEATDIWEDFQESFSSDESSDTFATLALTFFFRQPDLSNRGFEFTHRSFGEYLAARCMYRYLKENVKRLKRMRSVSDLGEWVALTSITISTPEIRAFFHNEFKRASDETLRELKTSLTNAMKLVLQEGMPVTYSETDNWRNTEKRQANSEGLLLTAISYTSSTLMSRYEDEEPVKIGLERGTHARNLIKRVEITDRNDGTYEAMPQNRYHAYPLSGINFSPSVFVGEPINTRLGVGFNDLDILRMFSYDLSYSDLSGCNIRNSGLSNTKLTNTNLEGSNLGHSIFGSCDFTKSNISKTIIEQSSIFRSNFSGMRLKGISFAEARIENTNFKGTIFEDVQFKGATIIGCDFSDADLTRTFGLTKTQLRTSRGSKNTKLPVGMSPPASWKKHQEQDDSNDISHEIELVFD